MNQQRHLQVDRERNLLNSRIQCFLLISSIIFSLIFFSKFIITNDRVYKLSRGKGILELTEYGFTLIVIKSSIILNSVLLLIERQHRLGSLSPETSWKPSTPIGM